MSLQELCLRVYVNNFPSDPNLLSNDLARSALHIKYVHLHGNPLVFSLPNEAKGPFFTKEALYRYGGSIQHKPVTPLGELTLALMQEWDPDRIEQLFSKLDHSTQNEIQQRICDRLNSDDKERSPSPSHSSSSSLSSSSSIPSSSDEENIPIFEDRAVFAQTLQQTIYDMFDALPSEGKINVYGILYVLNEESRGAHPDIWGKNHINDNIVALADAMNLS